MGSCSKYSCIYWSSLRNSQKLKLMGRSIVNKNADLIIQRKWFTDKTTIGELYDAATPLSRICFTLEDVARAQGVKIKGVTAIPEGDYFLRMTFSNRFQKLLPLLYNQESYTDRFGNTRNFVVTDGFQIWEGIRWHSGNTEADTEGCVLMGTNMSLNMVGDSRKALDQVLQIVNEKLLDKKELIVSILNSPLV